MTKPKDPKQKPHIGRPAVDGARNVKRVNVSLTPDLHELFRQLGGSVWLREQIRKAAWTTIKKNSNNQ